MEEIQLTSILALGFGFLHAIEPGHGKTALLTYVASGEKTWKEGVVISFSSAFTHSLAVLLIALVSHMAISQGQKQFEPNFIKEVLKNGSALLIIALGAWAIYRESKGKKSHCCAAHSHTHQHHDHDHSHSHSHDHHNHHNHNKSDTATGFISALMLGIATGIVPCPTLVGAYLSGLNSGNSFDGIQNIFFFAIGMALTLMLVVSLVSLGGEKLLSRMSSKKHFINWGYMQGSLLIAIGVFSAFYQPHAH